MAELSISQLIQESLMNEADGDQNQQNNKPSWFETQKANMAERKRLAGEGYTSGRAASGLDANETSRSKKLGYAAGRTVKHFADNKWKYGIGAGATAAAGIGGYLARKQIGGLVDKFKNRNSLSNKVQKFGKKHGGKVAAGTAAALGAAVGTKALLRYLRNKKKS